VAATPPPFAAPDPVVALAALTRTFGSRRALDRIDLTVQRGECLAVLGPNGAGKSTLLRVLAGLLEPTAGSGWVSGIALPGGPAMRATIGFVAHASMLYPALTARENVTFAARLSGLGDPAAAAARALARLSVLDRADVPVRALSRGLQQRVAIARADVHAPLLLLMDEPFTGLDAAGAAALAELLRDRMQAGGAVVLVTHDVAEGLALATRVAVLSHGRVVRNESRGELEPAGYSAGYRELVAAAP
jgi:heme ABC exporter ATP-binding subunit CcmA